ncbi:hypothetical protein LCGC14_1225610 [marine sediment metagenome]|uniref:Uncharacterized protein n=1 Tax=marine sediment metagenome TaxID=412755 RepID=A0A0F9LDY4_9ZZZZ
MNQDEIKKEIKDLSYGIQFHREQGDFHHGVADKRLASVKRLEAQLVEAEKPKLRHGDYGYDKHHGRFVVVSQATLDGSPKAIFESTGGLINADERLSPDGRLGNIFDDMKNMAEKEKTA